MVDHRWDDLRALLERLLELDRPGRAALMVETDQRDPVLARELRRLLRHDRRGDDFMEPPGSEDLRAGSAGPGPPG